MNTADRSIRETQDSEQSVRVEDSRSTMSPGDEAPPGTPATGEALCRICGGSGRDPERRVCEACGGTGKVTVGIGGA
jgi:DnaJ-class molecular chaperone